MFWWVVKAILGPILTVVWRPRSDGMENVPRRGPAILASNHLSFADHFFGPLPLRRPIVFLGKREYFTGKGLKGLLSRGFFSGVGVIPLDRTGGGASEEALRTGLRVLGEGKLLGIYPEGTRAPDNRLYRGKTGVARLALESRAPVVPMAMINTFELMPSGRSRPRLGVRPGVRFGRPLDLSAYYGREDDHVVLRTVTDEIMRSIRELSGQEYVDRYAADVKAELEGRVAADAGTGPDEDAEPAAVPPARPARDDERTEPEEGGDHGESEAQGGPRGRGEHDAPGVPDRDAPTAPAEDRPGPRSDGDAGPRDGSGTES